MRYRDLIPTRLGGRYIASHIHIPSGGPVPDYVHYHHIFFQMIFCYKGWVKVVYEDQGLPFIMYPGDCVLQPPKIRHRVLEASENLEVIEIGSPAIHKTVQDFHLSLPTPQLNTERIYDGQKFVHYVHEEWKSALNESFLNVKKWGYPNYVWDVRDTGIYKATLGIASVQIIRPILPFDNDKAKLSPINTAHNSDLLFLFVLKGFVNCNIEIVSEKIEYHNLRIGSSITIPSSTQFSMDSWSIDLELLEVEVYK
jgi:mannose-6-phosphate isomerase-like protein (cupin superfamily)